MISDYSIITCCAKKSIDIYPTAKDYPENAVRLIRSLRENGGQCKDIPVYAWYSKDKKPDDNIINQLKKYNASIIEGSCENYQHPLFNKITAMQTEVNTKYSIWMDSDIFILKDFSELLSDELIDVAAAPTTRGTHKWATLNDLEIWKLYYQAFGINISIPILKTQTDDKDGLFYLCSGLILFKVKSGFAKLYRDIAHQILNSNLPDKTVSFTQTALTLATLKGNFNYKIIPEKYHLVYAIRQRIFDDTVIVHYQDNKIPGIANWEITL